MLIVGVVVVIIGLLCLLGGFATPKGDDKAKAIIAALFLLYLGGYWIYDNVGNATQDKAISTVASSTQDKGQTTEKAKDESPKSEQTAVVDHKDEYVKEVQQFTDKIIQLDATFRPSINNYQQALTSNDTFKAYQAAKMAKEAAGKVRNQLFTMKVSDNLPDGIKKLIKTAKDNFSLAYSSREDGYDYAMKFLDDNKPSLLQKAKENFDLADESILRGTAAIIDAGHSLGTEIQFK